MTGPALLQKTWSKWILLFLFWTVLGLAFAGQHYLSRSKFGTPVSWNLAMGRALADWYVFALLSVPALWLGRRFPAAGPRWPQALAVHLLVSAAFSIGWMCLRAGFEEWRTRGAEDPVTFSAAFSQALGATFFFNLLVYWGIVAGQNAFTYYWKFHERELHAAALETRLTEARLQALQMQLNPHFLFNTLNAIASLMHKDVDAADRMIVRLSELLRYALDSTNEQEVPLRQELDFLGRYLDIQRARFGERLTIKHEVEDAAKEARVPNLILQPLVENAIEHGLEPQARSGEIVLRAFRRDGRLVLEVEDNGVGLKSGMKPSEGIGLSNTRARLQQLYGASQRLDFVSSPSGGLMVRIEIPFRSAGSG
ncbi:MAG: histidine kinase [Verrucomicrobia bacterium]|nr:histidine kinase [Verrucomicrobiota bacterium]